MTVYFYTIYSKAKGGPVYAERNLSARMNGLRTLNRSRSIAGNLDIKEVAGGEAPPGVYREKIK